MVHIIIVLGCSKFLPGGTKEKYTPKSHAYGRLSKTVEVYNSIQEPHKFVICSGGFGQAEKMKKFLVDNDVSDENVFVEPYSRNTIENCIFSYELLIKWIHSEPVANKQEVLNSFYQKTELEELIDVTDLHIHLVTDDYHIKRSEIIFNFFVRFLPYPVKKISCYGSIFLDYLKIPSESDIEEVTKAYENDAFIIENFLNKSLFRYQNWRPTNKEYIERM